MGRRYITVLLGSRSIYGTKVGVARDKKRIVYGNKSRPLTLLQRWLPVSYGAVLRLLQRLV